MGVWDWIDLKILVGVVVGGLLTFFTQLWLASRHDRKTRQRLASSILEEIRSLWDQYYQAAGANIEKALEPDMLRSIGLLAQERYFVIYESNCDKLGLFSRETLKMLIPFYNRAKGLLETIRDYDRSFGNHILARNQYREIIVQRFVNDPRYGKTLPGTCLQDTLSETLGVLEEPDTEIKKIPLLLDEDFRTAVGLAPRAYENATQVAKDLAEKHKRLRHEHDQIRSQYLVIAELQRSLVQKKASVEEALKGEGTS